MKDSQEEKKNQSSERLIIVGPPHLTRYEKSRIIGARALQISMGAPILLDIPKEIIDPIIIAEMELKAGVLPIIVRRHLPDGKYQDVPVSLLLQAEQSSQT